MLKDIINTLESNLIKAGYWDIDNRKWLAYNDAGLFFKTKIDNILKELTLKYHFKYDITCEKIFDSKACTIYAFSIAIGYPAFRNNVAVVSFLYFASY